MVRRRADVPSHAVDLEIFIPQSALIGLAWISGDQWLVFACLAGIFHAFSSRQRDRPIAAVFCRERGAGDFCM